VTDIWVIQATTSLVLELEVYEYIMNNFY